MKHIHKIFLSLLAISLLQVAGCAKDDGTAQGSSSDNATVGVSISLHQCNRLLTNSVSTPLQMANLIHFVRCAKDDGTTQGSSSDNATVSVSIPLQISNLIHFVRCVHHL